MDCYRLERSANRGFKGELTRHSGASARQYGTWVPCGSCGREWIVAVRVAAMGLRIIFTINVILGLLFFTGHAENLTLLHMLLGILFVATLWFLGAAQAMKGG